MNCLYGGSWNGDTADTPKSSIFVWDFPWNPHDYGNHHDYGPIFAQVRTWEEEAVGHKSRAQFVGIPAVPVNKGW